MIEKQKHLALIPARYGSKRLPKKNVLPLAGKPLIAWTIEAALDAKVFDEICVSTDSAEIAQIANSYGVSVPFLRPSELAGDEATTIDVAKHALSYYSGHGMDFGTLVLLQPTSPLRSTANIREAMNLYYERNALSVTSVCEMDHSPLWSNILPEDHSMNTFISPDVKGKRSQDLPIFYRLNGAIYIVRVDEFLAQGSFISSIGSYAYKMSRENSVDIDDSFDFMLAENIKKVTLSEPSLGQDKSLSSGRKASGQES